MDTSEQYIKMCDCDEVRNPWRKLEGDYFYGCYYGLTRIWIVNDVNSCCLIEPKDDAIWLPRQDQIQELCNRIHPSEWYNIEYTVWDDLVYDWQRFATGEQLWLAYYMLSEHKKSWNGKEWIKDDYKC